MRRLMAVGLASLVLLALWAVYLVPVASVLDIGFGPDGFRQYQPYVYARLRGTGPTIGGPGEYAVSVASCLPEGSTAWLLTAGGERLNVAGRIDSEVDTEQHWLFPLPKDDPPVRLVVRAGSGGPGQSDHPVRVLRVGGTLLGIKQDPSARSALQNHQV